MQPHFMALLNAEKLSHILGENVKIITTAAIYVSACHKLRLSASGQNVSGYLHYLHCSLSRERDAALLTAVGTPR